MSAPSVLAIAEVDENGEGPARLRIELHALRDGYRWIGADGSPTEVGGRTVEQAIENAAATWQGWRFEVVSRAPTVSAHVHAGTLRSVAREMALCDATSTDVNFATCVPDCGWHDAEIRAYAADEGLDLSDVDVDRVRVLYRIAFAELQDSAREATA